MQVLYDRKVLVGLCFVLFDIWVRFLLLGISSYILIEKLGLDFVSLILIYLAFFFVVKWENYIKL